MVEKSLFVTSDIVCGLYFNYITCGIFIVLPTNPSSLFFFGFVFFDSREASLPGTRASILLYIQAVSLIVLSFVEII